MRFARSRSWHATARMLMVACLSALATACSSPASRFYTLDASGESAIASRTTGSAYAIDVLSVKVPTAVEKSQMVVQESATQVKVLEYDRWASPVEDQLRNVVTATVTRLSGALDVHAVAHAPDLPVYRVSLVVRRFESWPGSHVLIDAVWTVRPPHGQEASTCHSIVTRTVSSGFDAIVAGHRRAMESLAAQIARRIRELVAERTAQSARGAAASGSTNGAARFCPS